MKISLLATSLFIIFACLYNANAQSLPARLSPQGSLKKDTIKKDTLQYKPKSIYLEAFGPGSFYSLNFDTRFKKFQNGLGMRVGFGYIFVDNENAISVPFVLNYLFGKNKHFFELGAGATYYYNFNKNYSQYLLYPNFPEQPSNGFSQYGSGVIGTFTTGYRYQPVKGGFTFRAGNSIIIKHEFLPFWPYVSFGYAFKNKPKASKVKPN